MKGSNVPLGTPVEDAPSRRPQRGPAAAPTLGWALEPRYMFDGAALVTAAQTATQVADGAGHPDAGAPAVADPLAAALAQFAAAAPSTPGPTEVRGADPAQNNGRKEVVFVDTAAPDYQQLVDGVKAGIEVELLDSAQDGLAQIARWAETHTGYDAIHIVAHGTEASLRLGSAEMTESTLTTDLARAETAIIGSALTDSGDLLIYGCDVAKGADGQRFVTTLAAGTGADVAASDTRVGSARLGGNWGLSVEVGSVETAGALTEAAMAGYDHALAPAHDAPDADALALAIGDVSAPTETRAADPSLNGGRREVVFIDVQVADYQSLVDGVRAGVGIQLIDSNQSGFSQIALWARTHNGYDAIHVLSHGNEATLQLGTDKIQVGQLPNTVMQTRLAAIGSALNAGGDLLFYGCNVGSGEDGRALIEQIAVATGADVAASTDDTGTILQGGNWVLEASTGVIDGRFVFDDRVLDGYAHVLATPSATTDFNGLTYTLTADTTTSTKTVTNVGSTGWDVSWAATTNGVSYLKIAGKSGGTGDWGFRVIRSGSTGDLTSVSLKSNDGSEFSFKSIDLWANKLTGTSNTLTLTGYKDGTAVTGATTSKLYSANGWQSIDATSISAFQNVDEIRITGVVAGKTGDGWTILTMDNIVIGPAVTGSSNAAPVLDASKSPAFTAQYQSDTANPSGAVGTLVSQLLDSTGIANYSDANNNSAGLAITGANSGAGTWYYSTNGGTSWTAVGSVSDAAALLLKADANTRLYLKTNGTYSGTLGDAITFRAWDGTTGTPGGTADTATNGGSTAFSTATDTASLTVNPSNSAPVLDASKSPALNAQNKTDQSIPSGTVGTLVSALIGTSGIANYSDGNGDSAGIALTGADTATATGSSWYYTTNGGTSWLPVGTVSEAAALLLKADANTRLYFVNNGTYSGTIASALTFRAWDQTAGTAGSTMSVASNGGTTAFSAASDTASLLINAGNTAPTFTSATTTLTVDAGSTNNSYASLVTVSDTDSGQVESWSVLTGPGHGTLALTGTTVTAASGGASLVAGSGLTYTPNAGYAGTDSFTIQVSDGTATITKTVTVTVKPSAPSTPDLLAASDSGNTTDNVTNATALRFSGTGAAYGSGSTDGSDVIVFISTQSNLTGDGAAARGSNLYTTISASGANAGNSGAWSDGGAGIDVSGLASGTYYVYAYTRSLIGGVGGNLSATPLTVTIDRVAPTLSASTPALNATAVSTGSAIQTTFSEAVQKGTGSIVLHNVTTNTDVETFDVATSAGVTGWGTATLTVTPTSAMAGGNVYSLRVAGTAVVDSAGNAYAGISNDSVITFTTANTAPTFTGGTTTLTVNKNASTAIDLASYLTVSDTDSNQTLTWTVSASPSNSGTLTVTGATASSGGASVAPGAGAITYKPAAGYSGTETFTIQVSDGISTATRTITVTVNAPPTVAATASGSTAYTEQAAAVAVDSGFTVADSEGNWNGGSFAVAVSAGSHSGDTLALPSNSGTGIGFAGGNVYYNNTVIGTATAGSVTGASSLTVTLNGSADNAAVQALARAVTFANSGTDPSAGNRTVTVTVTDAGGLTGSASRTVAFALKNDAPTLTATAGTSLTFTEGSGSGVTLFTAATAGTVESGQTFSKLVLTVANLQDGASEILTIDGTDVALSNGTTATTAANAYGVAVTVSGGTATLTITKTGATAAQIQTLVTGLAYKDTATLVTTGSRTVTLTALQDSGGTANGGSDTATLTLASSVSVSTVNHAPTLTATTATPTFTEGGTAAGLFSGASAGIGSGDSGQDVKALTLTVSNLSDGANEVLVVDGTEVALTNGNSVTTTANGYAVAVSLASGTATVTITKTGNYATAAAQTLIDGLAYKNLSSNPTTTGGRTVTLTAIQDSGGTTGGGADSKSVFIASTVTVAAVNDAPVLTVPGAQTVIQNSVYHTITGVSAADADAGGGTVTLTLSADQAGKIKLGTTTGLTLASGANDSDSMSFTGTLSAVNTALASLSFQTGRTTTGNETLTIAIDDGGNSGSGGAKTDSKTVTVAYTANDTPVVSVGSAQTYTTTGAHAISGVSVADTTSGATVTATVTAGKGTLTATGATSGGGTGTLTIIGTLSAVNAALATLAYTYSGSTSDTDTITVSLDDGYQAGYALNKTGSNSIGVTLTANSAPVITVPGAQTFSITSNNPISGASFTDGDAGATVTATVTVANTTDGSLSFTASGGATVGGTGTSRTITGTLADVNATLATMLYSNSSATDTSDTITVTINDGAAGSNLIGGSKTDSKTISIAIGTPPANVAPTLTATTATPTFTEGGSAVDLFSAVAVGLGSTDSGQDIKALTLTVSNLSDGASEVLVVDGSEVALTNGNSVTTTANGYAVAVSLASGTATVTITKTGNYATAAAQTLIDGLAYKNLSSNPTTTGGRTVTLTSIQDSGGTANSGADTTTVALASTVTVAAVNNTPVLTVPGTKNAYNTTTYYAITGVSAADADAGGGTVTVTLSADQAGKIKLGTTTGLTLASGANDSSTMSFTGTLSAVNAALASLSFQTGRTTTGNETLTIAIDDGGNSGSGGAKTDSKTVTVAYTANDTPVVSVGSAQTYTTTGAHAISGVSVADTISGATVTATVTAGKGTLTATGATSGGGTGTLTITGTLSAVNAALATLAYTYSGSTSDTDTITVSFDDGYDPDSDSSTPDGKTGSATIGITLTANSAGTVTVPGAQTVTGQTGNAITGISVADSDAQGQVTATVTVADTVNGSVSFTASGAATLGGTGTSRTITGTLADVNATLATLQYASTRTTGGSDTITVQFNDNGATANLIGGNQSDSKTIAVTVTANDAPTLTGTTTLSATDNVAIAVPTQTIADGNIGGGVMKLTVSASHGTLSFGTTTGLTLAAGSEGSGSVSYTGTRADLNAALATLQYTGNQHYHGADTIVVAVDDQQSALVGGNKTVTANIAATVTHTDIAPTISVLDGSSGTVTTANVYDTTPRSLAATISVADADVGSTVMTATVTATSGNLTIDNSGGATITGGNGTGTLTFTGTLAQINAALATLTYSATAANGADAVTITVSDNNALFDDGNGGNGARSGTATITVAAATVAAPDLTVPGGAAINDTVSRAVSGIAIGATSYASTVQAVVSAGGKLHIDTTTGVSITSGANDTTTITFTGTLAQVNAALASLAYASTATAAGSDTITVTTSFLNAVGGAQTATKTITQTLTENVAPTVDVPVTGPSYADTTQHAITGFSITDATVGGSVTATVTATKGNINITAGSATVTTNNTGTVTVSGTLADVNAALATLKYTTTATASGTDTITVSVNDGGTSYIAGAKTVSNSLTVTLTANDTPVLTLPAATPSFSDTNSNTVSDGYPTGDTGNHVISIADGSTGTYTVTVSNLHGKLTFVQQAGSTIVSGNGTGEVVITGSRDGINATLATLAYQTDVAATGVETISVLVSDGDTVAIGGAKTAQGTFQVALVGNDTPVVTAPAESIVVGDNHTRTVTGFSFADTRSGATITATVSATSGILQLTAAGGATIANNGTSSVTVTGSKEAVNATLASFTYQSSDSIVADTIQLSVEDGNGTAIGGAKTGLGQIAVVTAPNDAPVLAQPSDQTYHYTANSAVPAFAFTDSYYGGEYTATITVGAGSVTLSAVGAASVTANGTATVTVTGGIADVNATLATMRYTTTRGSSGTDTLTVSVDDNNINGFGGNQVSSRSITLNLVENDTPSIASAGDRIFGRTTNAISGFSVGDGLNEGGVSVVVSDISGLLSFTSQGGASVSGNGGTSVTISGSVADVNATLATLSYTATLTTSGTDTITLSVNDGSSARIGGAKGASTAITVTLIGNDAPSLALPSSPTFSQSAGNPLSGLVIADGLNDGAVTAVVSGASSRLTVTASGGATVGGNGSGSVTITGALADVNATLATLVYATTLTDSGTDTITVSVSDGAAALVGGARSTGGSMTVTLTGNDTPVLTKPVDQSFSTAAGNAIAGFSIADSRNTGTITATVGGSQGTLSFSASGGAVVGGNGSGTVTITGTLADVNATLATLVYATTLTGSGTDTITLSVSDGATVLVGGAKSASDSIRVTLNGNDAPSLTVGSGAVVATAGVPATVSGLVIAGNPGDAIVTVTLSAGHGLLAAGGQSGATITLTGSFAEINAILAGLRYTTTLGSGGTDAIAVSVSVGSAGSVGGIRTTSGSIAVTGAGTTVEPVRPTVTPVITPPPAPSSPSSPSLLLTTPTSNTGSLGSGGTGAGTSAFGGSSGGGTTSGGTSLSTSGTSVGGVDTGAHNSDGIRSISFGSPSGVTTGAGGAGNQVLTVSNMGGESIPVGGTSTTASPFGNQVLTINNMGGPSSGGLSFGGGTGGLTSGGGSSTFSGGTGGLGYFSGFGVGQGGGSAGAAGAPQSPVPNPQPGSGDDRPANERPANDRPAGEGQQPPAPEQNPNRQNPAPGQSGQPPEPTADNAAKGGVTGGVTGGPTDGAGPAGRGDQALAPEDGPLGFTQQLALVTGEFDRDRLVIEREFASFARMYGSAA